MEEQYFSLCSAVTVFVVVLTKSRVIWKRNLWAFGEGLAKPEWLSWKSTAKDEVASFHELNTQMW